MLRLLDLARIRHLISARSWRYSIIFAKSLNFVLKLRRLLLFTDHGRLSECFVKLLFRVLARTWNLVTLLLVDHEWPLECLKGRGASHIKSAVILFAN